MCVTTCVMMSELDRDRKEVLELELETVRMLRRNAKTGSRKERVAAERERELKEEVRKLGELGEDT